MESSSYGARSIIRPGEARDRERAGGRPPPSGPASGAPAPPFGSNGGAERTRAARWGRDPLPPAPGKPTEPSKARTPPSGTPAAAAELAAVFIPKARARTAGSGWGKALRPRPAPCGPALLPGRPRGAGTPHSGLGPPLAARWGAWLKGGPACGKRRHGRSCSVNESKCLGDRGLPGGRHAKGGGGGGGERAGEGGGEKKARAAATASPLPGMCTNPGEGDQRDLKQTGDWQGEGAGQPVESCWRNGGSASTVTSAVWLGVLLLLFSNF